MDHGPASSFGPGAYCLPFHSSIISRIRQFDRNIPRGKIRAKALGLLGTARLLAAQKDRWRGTVVFVAQPAEETLDGVKAMLADGLFKEVPRPNYCLALHCIGDLATGEVGITPGPALASVPKLFFQELALLFGPPVLGNILRNPGKAATRVGVNRSCVGVNRTRRLFT